MNKATDLKNALLALFRSGADSEHDETEMEELLEDIDFSSLLQVLLNRVEPVYEYRADGKLRESFDYRSRELFLTRAIKLYADIDQTVTGEVCCSHSYELWLMPNLTFTITSCFSVGCLKAAYATEYRMDKGNDWTETGITIDFVALADRLQALCGLMYRRQTPMFEL